MWERERGEGKKGKRSEEEEGRRVTAGHTEGKREKKRFGRGER